LRDKTVFAGIVYAVYIGHGRLKAQVSARPV